MSIEKDGHRTSLDPVRAVFGGPFGPTMTQQQFQKECDINEILRRAMMTGVMPGEEMRERGVFGDWTAVPVYQDALNIVARAQEQFELLPAELRARLDNDPAKFLDFVVDPKNGDELKRFGLFEPSKVEAKEAAAAAKKAAAAAAKPS